MRSLGPSTCSRSPQEVVSASRRDRGRRHTRDHCGSTLTKSTTLTGDLLQCPGTALVIGADGITVNLGGHTISGTNAKGSEGIANDGHTGVHIVGSGRISDFRLNGVGMRKAPKASCAA